MVVWVILIVVVPIGLGWWLSAEVSDGGLATVGWGRVLCLRSERYIFGLKWSAIVGNKLERGGRRSREMWFG